MKQRILIASDIHWCHKEWYGVSNGERMERFLRHVEEEHRRDPFEAVLLLGDYSLDHWAWEIKGCYLNEGRSSAKLFADAVLPRLKRLGVRIGMIAGNHEQYGEELWQSLTTHARQEHLTVGDTLFILLDTFGADLDPTEHSDGTYSGADVAYIRAVMDQYPKHKVILCAHHFAPERESAEFCELVRSEKRILCLFCGHVHKSGVVQLGEELGGKALLYTGNYSYSHADNGPPTSSMWGFRDLILTDGLLVSRYITPENEIAWEGKTVSHPYGYQDEYRLKLDF